jgi:hypothetical protein
MFSARHAPARVVSLACAVALATAQLPALAQSATGQKASLAEALFREGMKLMEQNKFHEACEKFAGSQREDPALGTLLHLADCHEKDGKPASAWAEFMQAAAEAKKRGAADREKYSLDHAATLETQMHRLQIDAKERPSGLTITLDGEPFSLGGLGTALPLDPGDHEVVANATGKKTWSKRITLAAGPGLDRVDVPGLEDAPVAAPAAKGTPAAGGETAKETGPDWTKRIIGGTLAAAGIGLGIGARWSSSRRGSMATTAATPSV